ncbi:MAG: KR domain-containing protein [Legionella sp.]|nr:KR domain-containing protein [Legionella sp.]
MSSDKGFSCSKNMLFKPLWTTKTFVTENEDYFNPDCIVIPALYLRHQSPLKLDNLKLISCSIIELKNELSFAEILNICENSINPHIVFISESGWSNPYYDEEHGLFLQWLQSLSLVIKLKLSLVVLNAIRGPNKTAVTNPVDAVYLGLIQSFAKENPNMHINNCVISDLTIDVLSRLNDLEKLTDKLSPIFLTQGSYSFIEFVPIKLSQYLKPRGFKTKGFYLILGGKGGLDLQLAIYLCQNYKAQIILSNKNKPTQELIDKFKGLSVIFEQHNLNCEQSLIELTRKYTRIDGIIHSELVLDDSSLRAMSQEKLIHVLAPKVKGTIHLIKALTKHIPDFVMFFSSVHSFIATKDQANYSAACLTQDALAHLLENSSDIKTHIINWGYLGNNEVVTNDFHHERMGYKEISSISTEECLVVIEQCLQENINQVLVMKASEKALQNMGLVETKLVRPHQKKRLLPLFNHAQEKIFHNKILMDILANYARQQFHQIRIPRSLAPKFEKLGEALTHIERASSPTRGEILNHYPELRGHLDLFDKCTENLPSILSGDICPLSIMFPEGSFSLVEPTYRNNPVSDYYNQCISAAVKLYIKRTAQDGKTIRILEVGAGTGSTSEKVLPQLIGKAVRYAYTDISLAFLKKAKEEFSKYDFIDYEIFNVECPEKITPFDIILATNVIHATKDIQKSVDNLFHALKDDGVLILNEMTERHDYATLIFGLTDGWWLDQDSIRIPYTPLLDLEAWEIVLHKAGFSHIYNHGDYGQHIIEAHKEKNIHFVKVCQDNEQASLL